MLYRLEFERRAVRDLDALDPHDADRVVRALKRLREDLAGNVKRLTNHTPEYRLRVGIYRVLFEVEEGAIFVYRIRHRKDAYNK